MDWWLTVAGALAVAVVLASAALRHLPATGAALALVVGVIAGPEVTGVLSVPSAMPAVRTVTELLLAVSLMAVALRFPLRELRPVLGPVSVLVTIGMLGMAATGAVLVHVITGAGCVTALLLGAVLAPTDPVLAASVVTGGPAERVLPRSLRQTLSLESGANDGLAWPLVVVAVAGAMGSSRWSAALEAVVGIAVAVAAGAAIGATAGWALRRLEERREVEGPAYFVATLALAGFTLGSVNLLHGDGVLGVLVAGLAFNAEVGEGLFTGERDVDEGVNRVLVVPVFLLLGAVLPWDAWASAPGTTLGLVVAVLLLRRLPTLVVLGPVAGLARRDRVFLGWFGPVGVAALFYATWAVEEGVAEATVWPATAAVVAASTIVHGVTAAPGRALYGRTSQRTPGSC
jgi:NhaP-type Na+/H+ or K+/H+ antiporter